ncbi:MAG: hypothetical protein GY799_24075 [Desulfobulbaceae bacterium]|nr:hypothetical protein [Desulfobulbaceae bacterium]
MSEKIRESVRQLGPGRKIKVKCVHCAVPFGLDESSMKLASPGRSGARPAADGLVSGAKVKPPAPPSTDWLKDGSFEEKEVIEDIPEALVLMPAAESLDVVVKAAMEFGYHVEQAPTPEEAIEKMRFVNYAAVFLHSSFEPGGVKSGKFHQFMRSMNMSRRRYIFYVLIGEQFETLYDLQALANSVNLVINDNEVPYIGTVLKKAIPEFETLFGPLMEELHVVGK